MSNNTEKVRDSLPATKARADATTNLPPGGQPITVTFGNVTVSTTTPDPASVEQNIKDSGEKLERALRALLTPGVKLTRRAGVAYYHAHPEREDLLVRVLDGQESVGKMQGGLFVQVEP